VAERNASWERRPQQIFPEELFKSARKQTRFPFLRVSASTASGLQVTRRELWLVTAAWITSILIRN
jgi:hypothetical protein